ncbi:MAG: transcriptional regulator [Lysobacteraceae bacterium]|nr:MAG: transcriptional regulator [Xanthomonadaceae bacterium]
MSYTILASVLVPIWRVLERNRIDPEALFRSCDIDPDLLRDPDARYRIEKNDAMWAAVLEATGDRTVVFKIVEQLHPSTLHALGYGWLSSDTLNEAFDRFQRFFAVVSSIDGIHIEREDGELRIWGEGLPEGQRLKHGFLGHEYFAVVLTEMVRWLAGYSMSPLRVMFEHPAPVDCSRYFEYFRCPVEFSQPGNRLIFDLEGMDQPLPTGNARLSDQHDAIAGDYLDRLGMSSISDRVRRWLSTHLPGGNVSQESAAQAMHLSARSLQRRLSDESQTWSELLEDTRRKLAQTYLASDPNLTTGEVAWLVGFTEPANFARAFKRWTGMTPTEYRQSA